MKVLGAALMVFVFYQMINFALHKIEARRIHVEPARIGDLNESDFGVGRVINRELVAYAPRQGRFENLVLEGERIRRGTPVGQFQPDDGSDTVIIRAPGSGVVCYHPDGLERDPSIVNLTRESTGFVNAKKRRFGDGSMLFNENQPMFKIVDNLTPTKVVVLFPGKTRFGIVEGTECRFIIENKIDETARCQEIMEKKGREMAVFEMASFGENLWHQRRVKVECVSESYHGMVTAQAATFRKNGILGVYVVMGNRVFFKPIRLIHRKGDRVVVKGLYEGDPVVTTPWLVREGMLLPEENLGG